MPCYGSRASVGPGVRSPKEVEMKRFVLFVAAVFAAGLVGFAPLSVAADAARWGDTGPKRPAKRGKREKDFATSASGAAQSPIDIPHPQLRKGDLPPLLL